jgi:hypothetical protein
MKLTLPENNKPPKKEKIRWRKRGGFICATIKNQYVSIDIKNFTVVLKNGFKISATSIEDAKNKVKSFLE